MSERARDLDRLRFSDQKDFSIEDLVSLYRSVGWSSANKPRELQAALANSHSVVSAWLDQCLIGLGSALSDGHLVVYYPHLLVQPQFQGRGIGRQIMNRLQEKYSSFHTQILVSDGSTVRFYERCGFQKAGRTQSMWVYAGGDHD
jgi:GNAT superfamily N-acetyltransferase